MEVTWYDILRAITYISMFLILVAGVMAVVYGWMKRTWREWFDER